MTAILLAGGFGTRVKKLYPDVPKCMIPVAGRPFLDWVIQYWASQGADPIVVSLGHLAEVAEVYLRSSHLGPPQIATVREPQALGTGGAIEFAARSVPLSDPFVAANGDTLVLADLSAVPAILEQGEVDGVILGLRVPDTGRYGALTMGAGGRLTGFEEKRTGCGVISGGIYFLRRRVLESFPAARPLSIERDVFPALVARGAGLRVHVCEDAPFLDMGTPASLAAAGDFVRNHMPALERS